MAICFDMIDLAVAASHGIVVYAKSNGATVGGIGLVDNNQPTKPVNSLSPAETHNTLNV
ncbi:hypothetical protein IGI41_001386 [Enterococcus sp. DIV0876]